MYREAVGSLMYLSSCMQPDLSFVLSKLWQQFKEATLEHYRKNNQETKHCGTVKVAHGDSGLAAEVTDRRSTTWLSKSE